MWPFAIALASFVGIGLWIALPVDDLVADVAHTSVGTSLPGMIGAVRFGGRMDLVETVVVAAILGGLAVGIGLVLRLVAGWNRGGWLARALSEVHVLRDLRPLALGVVAALAVALGISVALDARPAPIVAQCFVLAGLAMLLVPRSEVADPGVVVTGVPFRRPPQPVARAGLDAGAVRVGTDARAAGALPVTEAPASGWTCPRCGLRQDAWSLRCAVDGRLRL
ncbi:MAG: hypothetical protein M3O34_11805, partial [Chloroflexota bacterium]|nr:hypothetical protein [Chloroflexota bacterium]